MTATHTLARSTNPSSIKFSWLASLFAPLLLIGCANTNNTATNSADEQALTQSTHIQENTMSDNPTVKFDTTMGDFTVELNSDAAPKTVANFLSYVESGHYNGTIFHRVIPGFMVQGGGMTSDMSEKPTNAPVEIEADNGLKNEEGTIAMARTQDPNSATSQFFVNVKDNGFLNHSGKSVQGWGYTVFGKVTDGMDVIKQIEGVPTGRFGMHADVPKEPVIINSATLVTE